MSANANESQPSTTTVIVTYRSLSTIDSALDCARDVHEAGEGRYIVVDNASGDGVLDCVREKYDFVEAIDSGANLGFGRGCNLGALRSTTRYTLFLNPDAAMPLPALRTLVRFMDENLQVGICAPYIENQAVGMLTRPQDIVHGPPGFSSYPDRIEFREGDCPFRTSWVCGAALLIRTELFRRLGGFDPRFFLYFEETDLCLRAARAGAEIWVVPTATATHAANSSTSQSGDPMFFGCIAEHYFQSRFYYFRKHYGLVVAAAAELVALAEMIVNAGISRILRRPDASEILSARLRGPLLSSPPKR